MSGVLDVVVTGLVLGGLYALIAVGLSLQYGVGRVLNVAHGELIILGSLIAYSLFTSWGINPILAIVAVAPLFVAVGFGLDRTVFDRLRRTSVNDDHFEGRSLLASFGLLFMIQNLMLLVWGADLRSYSFLQSSVSIFGNQYGLNRILALAVSVVASLGLYWFIQNTRSGKAIRAAAENPDMASTLGVNKRTVLATCFALGAGLAGVAGVLYSMMFQILPGRGIELTTIAIVVVVLGGLGSITGSLIGGFLLGMVISAVNAFDPSLSVVAFYLIFTLVLLVRPSGIFGRAIHAG